MYRDFTYIDDVVSGVLAVSDAPAGTGGPLHRIYNVGNGRPVALMDMIAILEQILGRRAEVEMLPMQPGEMIETSADISAIQADFGFRPRVTLEEGLRRFVEWHRRHHGTK
jgi:UDP-glucuronate 4-epimerase